MRVTQCFINKKKNEYYSLDRNPGITTKKAVRMTNDPEDKVTSQRLWAKVEGAGEVYIRRHSENSIPSQDQYYNYSMPSDGF
jgi:hypothetical protein